MAVPLIAYPFRLSPSGSVVTVEEGTDEQHAHELAVAVLTRTGERPLVPDFGTADPVFVGFDNEALRLHVDLFGPPVDITAVAVTFVDDSTQSVVIEFD
jgi:hypothetical protein